MARDKWPQFLSKATEFFLSAQEGSERKRWNASVSNAVHAGILACDAITVGPLGRRNTGEHHEIVSLVRQAVKSGTLELEGNLRRIGRLLEIKNVAEYEGRPLGPKDAAGAILDAERLLGFATAESRRF